MLIQEENVTRKKKNILEVLAGESHGQISGIAEETKKHEGILQQSRKYETGMSYDQELKAKLVQEEFKLKNIF